MSNNVLSGVVKNEGNPIVFNMRNDDFNFHFLSDKIMEFGKYEIIEVPTVDSFICGKTYQNHKIAIYAGLSPLKVRGDTCLRTAAYVKATSNVVEKDILHFDAISIGGKILNNVFKIKGIRTEYLGDDKVLKYNDDSISSKIVTDEYTIDFDIRSHTTERYSLSEGQSIDNSEVAITLKFDKRQPTIKVFEHYNKMRDLISFMIYRSNVDFDSIFLLQKNTEGKYEKIASVHIKSNVDISNKSRIHNIMFNDISENLPRLVKLLYDSKEGEQTISLGFIPDNDDKSHIMTNEKVRQICSAIECELKFASDLNLEKDKVLRELSKLAAEVVKDFRKEHTEIDNSSYNSILTSIGYWSLPLSEKVKALFRKYEEFIIKLNRSQIVVTEESIGRFIQYRNDITHGKHRTLDEEIAITGHLLCGVIYCCVLERIGFTMEEIKHLCDMKILW